jgi:hypothetical protein
MALAKIASFLAKAILISIPFPPAKAGGNSAGQMFFNNPNVVLQIHFMQTKQAF